MVYDIYFLWLYVYIFILSNNDNIHGQFLYRNSFWCLVWTYSSEYNGTVLRLRWLDTAMDQVKIKLFSCKVNVEAANGRVTLATKAWATIRMA